MFSSLSQNQRLTLCSDGGAHDIGDPGITCHTWLPDHHHGLVQARGNHDEIRGFLVRNTLLALSPSSDLRLSAMNSFFSLFILMINYGIGVAAVGSPLPSWKAINSERTSAAWTDGSFPGLFVIYMGYCALFNLVYP